MALYRYCQVATYLYSLNYSYRENGQIVKFSILLQFAQMLKHACYNLPRRLVQLAPYQGK